METLALQHCHPIYNVSRALGYVRLLCVATCEWNFCMRQTIVKATTTNREWLFYGHASEVQVLSNAINLFSLIYINHGSSESKYPGTRMYRKD